MTNFNQILFKIFKQNIRRYRLYFFCSTFSVMIFFAYATIFTNEDFMDYSKVDSSISSMIYVPSFCLGTFSVFFIIYAHNSFLKYRKSEFGLFMVLGMTNRDIRNIILIENSVIALSSIFAGILSGTVFSRIFFFLVQKISGIDNISFMLTYKSFIYTILFFIIIYTIVILFSFVECSRYEILTLLKEVRRGDKNLLMGAPYAFLGVIILLLSLLDLYLNYSPDNSNIFFRSFILCFLGLYLLLSNLFWILKRSTNKSSKRYLKNVLFLSELKISFGRSKKILFVISFLLTVTLSFTMLSIMILSDAKRIAILYNPFHVAYAELYGANKISDNTLKSVIDSSSSKASLKDSKSLEFIKYKTFTILSDESLNIAVGSSLNVEKGKYIILFQVVVDDGYQHEKNIVQSADLPNMSGYKAYIYQGELTKVLFNIVPQVSNGYYLIFNNEDYLDIKKASKESTIGILRFFNFSDWRHTSDFTYKLSYALQDYNKKNSISIYGNEATDKKMLAPVSRLQDYISVKNSGSFLLFLLSFVGFLFTISCGVILHFKLQTDFEREKLKFKKLSKIGITDREASKIITKSLNLLFFLPYGIAVILSTFFSVFLDPVKQNTLECIQYSFILGLTYLAFQLVFFMIYRPIYIKKLIEPSAFLK